MLITRWESPNPITKGHFTHEPRAVTMKLWEPTRKGSVPRPSQTHLWNHAVLSRTLECGVKAICDRALNHMLFRCIFYSSGSSCVIEWNKPTIVSVRIVVDSWFCVRPTSKRWFSKNNSIDHENDWSDVNSYVTRPQTICYFNAFSIQEGPHAW